MSPTEGPVSNQFDKEPRSKMSRARECRCKQVTGWAQNHLQKKIEELVWQQANNLESVGFKFVSPSFLVGYDRHAFTHRISGRNNSWKPPTTCAFVHTHTLVLEWESHRTDQSDNHVHIKVWPKLFDLYSAYSKCKPLTTSAPGVKYNSAFTDVLSVVFAFFATVYVLLNKFVHSTEAVAGSGLCVIFQSASLITILRMINHSTKSQPNQTKKK